MAPYTDFSDKLWPPSQISVTSLRTSYTKLSDKLWTPTLISVTIVTRILVKVKNEGEYEVFQTFHHVHSYSEVFLHHIYRDKLSLDSPFKGCGVGCLKKCKSVNLLTGFHTQLCLCLKLTHNFFKSFKAFLKSGHHFKNSTKFTKEIAAKLLFFQFYFVSAATLDRIHLFF